MSHRAQPRLHLGDTRMPPSKPKIHTHTHRDVNSPSTAPLLGFLLHFAKKDHNYLDAIKKTNSKKLWDIGRNSTPGSCWPCPCDSGSDDGGSSDDGKKASEDGEVHDESQQDEDELLNIVNGTGLPRPTKTYDVTIVGGGVSGLVAAYELKRSGFNVHILEASSRVGGRVITLRDPFAPGLHAEGGAMRIPQNHYLLHAYIKNFNIDSLFDFEMKNKFIYLSGYLGGSTLTYDDFDRKLVNEDSELLKLFPNLKPKERGRTCDDLFFDAVAPVVALFKKSYSVAGTESQKIHNAYQAVTGVYDRYSLRSYLKEVAQWSPDALRLFDLGNAHVVFENGFIESWKDAFLSSNRDGAAAKMEQLQNGMDQVPKAFLDQKSAPLAEDITYGARVINIADINQSGDTAAGVRIDYETCAGDKFSRTSDFVVLSVPYTAQRAITKSRPFSPVVEQAIRDVRYIGITKILLQYQNRWWEKVFGDHGQGTDGGLLSDLPIRYTMFPKTEGNSQIQNTQRGALMASYTFQQDATILGSMSAERQVRVAAKNLDQIFPSAKSLQLLEAGISQVFPSDELAGGSAFCYFAPGQKSEYLETMCQPAWPYPEDSEKFRVFFAGEHASYTHGWIHGAMEAGLRCVAMRLH